MQINRVECDICGKEVKNGGRKNQSMSVVFLTEQTQGTPVQPYLSSVVMDICETCYDKFIKNFPLTATGAMGYNTYTMGKVQNNELME